MKKMLKTSKVALAAGLVMVGLVGGYFAHVALAGGIPATTPMTYSGLLEDANGAPLTGWRAIDFRLWDDMAAGTKQCEVLSPTSGANSGYDLGTSGRFSITLPDDCTAAVKSHPDLWVEVRVAGAALPRTKLGAVPYAVEAGHAVSADTAANATKVDVVYDDILAADDSDSRIHGGAFASSCISNPQQLVQCAIAANRKCVYLLGYKAGWYVGESADGNERSIACLK